MTIRHLRIFLSVTEAGSITGAASRLYLSQPSVSLAVKELEEHYGIRLFERLNKRIKITEEGKLFQTYAAHIVRMFDEMETAVANRGQVLRVGSSITIGTRYMPGYCRAFREANPQVTVRVHIASSDEIEAMVLSGDLDLGVIEGTAHSGYLVSRTFLQDYLVPICPPESPLAHSPAPTLQEFLREPLLLREKGSGTRELLDDRLAALGIEADPLWESTSSEAVINGVLLGNGVSILSQKLVKELADAGRLCIPPIGELLLKRDFRIITHKNKFITAAMEAFTELVERTAPSLGEA